MITPFPNPHWYVVCNGDYRSHDFDDMYQAAAHATFMNNSAPCTETHHVIGVNVSTSIEAKDKPMYGSSTDPVEDIQSAWETFQEAAGEFDDAVQGVTDPDEIEGWRTFKQAFDAMERYIALCGEQVEALEPNMVDASITCRATITMAWDQTNGEPTDFDVDISDITVEDRNGNDRTDSVQGQNIVEVVGNLDFDAKVRRSSY